MRELVVLAILSELHERMIIRVAARKRRGELREILQDLHDELVLPITATPHGTCEEKERAVLEVDLRHAFREEDPHEWLLLDNY